MLRIVSCFIALCATFLTAFAAPVFAEIPPHHTLLEGLVVGVNEGDRLTVNSFGNEIPVRLYGIATPQTAKIDKFTGWYKPGQPYAEDAFRALSLKVLHQRVKIEIRSTVVSPNDRSQVAVAIVYLDGRNINLEMLNDGWAWVYKRLLNRTDYHRYSGSERLARARKNGLWVQENPQAPWEFKPPVRIKPKPHP